MHRVPKSPVQHGQLFLALDLSKDVILDSGEPFAVLQLPMLPPEFYAGFVLFVRKQCRSPARKFFAGRMQLFCRQCPDTRIQWGVMMN